MDTLSTRISDALAAELGHESDNTRKMLDRVPDERFGWNPHEKSMTLGRLASHIAELPRFVVLALTQDGYNIDPASYQPWQAANREELLAKHDAEVAAAKAALQGFPDDRMMMPWRFTQGDNLIFELPRAAVVRFLAINHLIHHRGQLSVYLRLLDVPVPGVYGPSADER